MMILAAVLLVIGLIALAGMVARVNQLGSQTSVEADKAILNEVTPLQDSIDEVLCRITVNSTCGAASLRHFNLTATSYIKAEDAVRNALEQLQRMEAGHGFWMDYQITCVDGSGLLTADDSFSARGVAVVHLSDGTVWLELRSAVFFPRSAGDCAPVLG
ncbi:MAG: hypothetical protein WC876_10640 [Candidatus Thermoplasmatota archaeon]|jgi:hypothetical protein